MTAFDPAGTFLLEARELLRELEAGLLELEQRPDDRALVDTIFRALHTLKGSGGMFGPPALATFAHEVETRFEGIRRGSETATPALTGLLLAARDHLEQLLEAPDTADPAETERLVVALRDTGETACIPAAPAEPVATEPSARAWRIGIRLPATALEFGTNPLGMLDELRALGPCEVRARTEAVPALGELDPTKLYLHWDVRLVTTRPRAAIEDVFIFVADSGGIEIAEDTAEPAPECASVTVAAVGPPAAPANHDAPPAAAKEARRLGRREAARSMDRPEASVRVAASRLDALLDQVGELVIAQARLTALAQSRKDPVLTGVVEEIERLAAELRESTMGLRMLPIGTLFGRYRRVVRDLSQELGKAVELTTAGEATELDKTMIERLGDPLVHLIRNAVDHGIEDAATRRAAGKPAHGSLHLEARQAGAEVLISIKDDGAGLNRARIREKAVARGLIAADAVLSERAIDQLIFHPGLSTAATISNISGRGVGMDVVKQTIEDLRGSIEVASAPGAGTTITLRLPLTLAIIDGLLVRVGASMCVVPLAAIEECVELAAAEHKGSSGRSFLDVRGALVPFLRLSELFGVGAGAREHEMVVIVASEQGRVGLVVDQVVGHHQTVIKSLSPLHRGIPGLGGATILSDGQIALILDTTGLIQSAQDQATWRLSA
ncbi:chemotaxis protein CheA [Benzoatithermus flavus]|uniref:Chemotaxis protein CheA n=1 Tax=Benzoatithermus flavus TaxID=3108223 RepID=A0ABU8XWV0_9PROT